MDKGREIRAGNTKSINDPVVRMVAGCLSLISASFLFFAVHADAALYIGTGGIARANLDGSLLEPSYIGPRDGTVCAIAVDSSHIYWADSYDNTIGRANLDGTDVEDSFIRLANGTLPCGLAVDREFIYWPNMGTDTIGRAQLDGSDVDETFILTAQHPCAVAVNETAIYWASDDEDEIWRTDIAGANAPEIVIDEHASDSCGIALRGSDLFWVESDTGTIGRANLDGSDAFPNLISGGDYPVSLVAQGKHLYWVNHGRDSVGRAAIDGSGVDQTLISGLMHPYALAADSVQIVASQPALEPGPSFLRLGKLRRQRRGSVLFPVDLFGDGWFEARVPGAKVTILPERLVSRGWLPAGRKWLKVTPTTKRGNGSRCIRRAFRRGAKVKLELNLRFTETGKLLVAKSRKFFFFKPRMRASQRRKRKIRRVNCRKRRMTRRSASVVHRRGNSFYRPMWKPMRLGMREINELSRLGR